jgi:hypothetical protein
MAAEPFVAKKRLKQMFDDKKKNFQILDGKLLDQNIIDKKTN